MIFEILTFLTYVCGGAVAGGAVGGAIVWLVAAFIDEDSLRDSVHYKFPEAFKMLIKKKKKTAINVGIFTEEDETIESDLEIRSEEGVSDSLYVGQVIYL